MTTLMWNRSLLVASLAVAGYGVSMVVVPTVKGGLFEGLGFGMRQAGVTEGPARSYVLFIYGVLGAVLVGWMTLIAAITAGPLSDGKAAAGLSLACSLGAWFVLDTGLSIVVGEWQHALFNFVFVAVLGLPLVMSRRSSRRVSRHVSSGPQ